MNINSVLIAVTLILISGVGVGTAQATQIQEDTAQLFQLEDIQDTVTAEGRRRGGKQR
ncbi:MAG: hypothetical protein ACFB4I_21970 [Cyanophyceae cyanobacterium]